MKTTWKCIGECGRDFGVGDWECTPGIKHQIEEKTYYLKDAPHDPTGFSFRNSGTWLENIPPEKKINDAQTGQARIIPGGRVHFVRGVYATKDAEEQFYIDRAACTVSKEEWERVYFSAQEKMKLREVNLHNREAEVERKLQQANDLLESVSKGKKTSASV